MTTIDSTELKQRLDFAVDAALEAGELILRYYQNADLVVDLKGDSSPVTAADRGAEQLLRERIASAYPEDGVMGEEFPEKPSDNGFRWILDPIDGTKPFVHGVPLFGTLIGLEFEERIVVGVSRFPALNEVAFAAEGLGTWWQIGAGEPRRARVSDVGELAESNFCFTDVHGWDTIGRRDAFNVLSQKSRIARGWGDCYGHVLVATGRAEMMVDPLMSSWDAAALVPIVQEAGGHFLDWTGQPSIDSGNGFSVNKAMKDVVLDILKAP